MIDYPIKYAYSTLKLKEVFQNPSPKFKWAFLAFWFLGTFASILLGVVTINLEWSGIPITIGGIKTFVTIYPPLIICTLYTLWFGFFWGFVPAYFATLILSLYSGMSLDYALIFAFADPLGLVVIALAYKVVPISIHFLNYTALFFFTLISFIGGIVGSSGCFIWTHFNNLDINDTYAIWQGWWFGGFLQAVFLNIPLLYLFTPKIHQWKETYTAKKIWAIPKPIHIIATLSIMLSVVIAFVLIQNYFINRSILSLQTELDPAIFLIVKQSLSNTKLIIFIALSLVFYAVFLSYQIIIQWVTTLEFEKLEAEKISQYKTDFLATMSHEIRTPMNGVIATTSLLMDTPLNVEQQDYAVSIQNSGNSLLAIINDILDFSKIESGKMALANEPFDLNKCIENVFNLVASKASEQKIELYNIIEDNVPLGIIGDQNRLQQILLNLLGNALKFTSKGAVWLHIQKLEGVGSLCTLSFKVCDTGIGIPQKEMNNLFISFSQVDTSASRKHGGTGLGLSICKRLVELMGGQIRVHSQEGNGSVFSFTIPVETSIVPSHSPPISLKNSKLGLVTPHTPTFNTLQRYCSNAAIQLVPTLTNELSAPHKIVDYYFYDIEANLPMHQVAIDLELLQKLDRPIICSIPWGKTMQYNYLVTTKQVFFIFKPIQEAQFFKLLVLAKNKESIQLINYNNPKSLDNNLATQYPMEILLAEDNPMNQKVAQKIFEKLGYKIDLAENGRLALEAVKNKAYHLIFMDIQMPEMDGIQATKLILNQQHSHPKPIIIAMTANVLDKEYCLAIGMSDFIPKPISTDLLQSSIKKWGEVLLLK